MGKKRRHSGSHRGASSRNIQNETLDKPVVTTMKIDNGMVDDSEECALTIQPKVMKNLFAAEDKFQSKIDASIYYLYCSKGFPPTNVLSLM